MTNTISNLEEAYRQGVARGRHAAAMKETSPEWSEAQMHWMRNAYPRCAEVDLWNEIITLDRERMDSLPDPAKFPETRGMGDVVRRERQGFLDGAGCDERAMIFCYNRFFFASRRLNTRFAGSSPENLRAAHCTGVYIRDTAEGGPLFGRNLDDVRLSPELEAPFLEVPPARAAVYELGQLSGRPWFLRDNVSSAVIGDEEPQEIFPIDAWEIMPEDCNTLRDMVDFLKRYGDFWGPCNAVLVDRHGDSAAIEKSNCRMAVRISDNGVSAVTACSYLDPAMSAFKNDCARRVLAADAPDWTYWDGCDARHRRLLELTDAAHARGATLEDMGAIVTDHAVPYPERICLAGEVDSPEAGVGNWTWTSKASVLSGPNRRTLFWTMRGDTPAYARPPALIAHDDLPEVDAFPLREPALAA